MPFQPKKGKEGRGKREKGGEAGERGKTKHPSSQGVRLREEKKYPVGGRGEPGRGTQRVAQRKAKGNMHRTKAISLDGNKYGGQRTGGSDKTQGSGEPDYAGFLHKGIS